MTDQTTTQTPTASAKAPISSSTVTRASVVAGGIAFGPQILVPIIHQFDIMHYAADKMPDANFEWSVATVIVALASIVPNLLIRGQALFYDRRAQ